MSDIIDTIKDYALSIVTRLHMRNLLRLNNPSEIGTELLMIEGNLLDIEREIMKYYEKQILENDGVVFDERNYTSLLSFYDKFKYSNKKVLVKLIAQSKSGKFKTFENVKNILSVSSLEKRLENL